MKLSKMALVAAIACGIHAGNAFGQQAVPGVQQVAFGVADCDCGQPVCGCEAPACGCGTSACDGGCDSGCASGCGLGLGSCLDKFDCCLGDPWTLFGEHCGWSAGGWINVGGHTARLNNFNNRPDEIQLHQAWLYAEKAIDTSNGFSLGGRIDYLYGTDAQDTQAFGTDPRGWDNPWDNGSTDNGYGHAIPQLYAEAGYGDWSVKLGHFFTTIGWEVVAAPDNFFYSNAYTMYNSEPFTHTGALVTYNLNDETSIWGGYVLGWDSGFDDNGDAYLSGFSRQLTNDLTIIYSSILGRFGEARFNGVEKGYMQSLIADYAVSDNLQYIFQTDYLDTEDDLDVRVRNSFGINQYLIYTLSDCWAVGGRFEWWNVAENSVGFGGDALADGNVDIYALTLGVNYRPTANFILRPEARYDWHRDDAAAVASTVDLFEDGGRDQFTFGMDAIFTF